MLKLFDGSRMIEINPQEIPAIARRIARDKLATRIGELEAELADAQATSSRLIQAAAAAQQEFEAFRRDQEVQQRSAREGFDTALGQLAADNEALRVAAQEMEGLAHSCEAGRAEAEAKFAAAQQEFEAFRRDQEVQQRSAREGFDTALGQLAADNEALRVAAQEMERLAQSREAELISASHMANMAEHEIVTCRSIAERCIFVIGFARSNTTITLEILNCAKNALILGEADFFLRNHGKRFNDWYNDQHKNFQNQITKSSYAPDFLPEVQHEWWQWLDSASQFYDYIGEKIALSHYHMGESPPAAFRAFHEARFLSSRYIFMLRNPIDVLLSSAKLMSITDDQGMIRLCIALLDFLQIWADSIRVFPRTITLIAERFGEATVSELEAFTGLDLGDARLLINPANQRQHKLTPAFPTLVRFRSELEEIYADAIAAADENSALWQAEQKRTTAANDTAGNAKGMIAMTSRPLGRVWLRVQALRETLSLTIKENNRDI